MSPSKKSTQTSTLKWQPKGEVKSKPVNAPSKKQVNSDARPSTPQSNSPHLGAKAILNANKPRRRSSDDEETCLESEVSIYSSGDESWNSGSQNGRAAGKQLLSLIQPQSPELPKNDKDEALTQEASKSGRTKLSSGAAAFCPGGVPLSNGGVALSNLDQAKIKSDQLLDNLRMKLTEDDGIPPSSLKSPPQTPTLEAQLNPCKSQSPDPESVSEPLQSGPKRYSTFDPMQHIAPTPPSSKTDKAPDTPAPTPKPGRTPLGRTPLSVKAAVFQPRQFIPGSCIAFQPPPGTFGIGPQWNPNGFHLSFSPELPNCQKPLCSVPEPSVEAPQELSTPIIDSIIEALPFESLLGDYEVSNGILVAKCKDGSPPQDKEDDTGANACSPISTCTSTPAPPSQKISWADLSDDDDTCPWLNMAPPEDRLD